MEIPEKFTMKTNNLFKRLRGQIEKTDEKIFFLLEERLNLVRELAKIKKERGIHLIDVKRQEELVQKIKRGFNNLGEHFIEEIFQTIFDYSKINQLSINRNMELMKNLREKPLLIAGPCSVESREQIEKISAYLNKKNIKFLRGGIFKPRTCPESFQGLGIDGLVYLREAANKNNQYVVTEVMTTKQLDWTYDFVDVIQVGSRNMTSFGLLKAIGKKTARDKKPILLKRGTNSTISEFINAAKYIAQYGNNNIILCLRGIRTFEQIDSILRNTPDLASILELKEKTNYPIIFDPSHATGNTEYVPNISKAALELGADGIMVEVHHNPSIALSDGDQSLNFKQFDNFLREIKWTQKLSN